MRDTVASESRPLDIGVRREMESRFGHDFGSVRIHFDEAANRSAVRVDAHAYTVGEHVVVEHPSALADKPLLAHELAHVVQQRRGGSASTGALEHAADHAARMYTAGGQVSVHGAGPIALAKQSREGDRGRETVAGLGARKRLLRANAGTLRDMAIAMLETRTMMADYVYGDGKTGDAANFGIFKQNWMMIRGAHAAYRSLGATDFRRGAELNANLALDIQVLHESMAHYGANWFAGHRNGATGLLHPSTPDIAAYQSAVTWIESQLSANATYQTDDTRFWVQVHAI